jgi:hypothetical protein
VPSLSCTCAHEDCFITSTQRPPASREHVSSSPATRQLDGRDINALTLMRQHHHRHSHRRMAVVDQPDNVNSSVVAAGMRLALVTPSAVGGTTTATAQTKLRPYTRTAKTLFSRPPVCINKVISHVCARCMCERAAVSSVCRRPAPV